MKVYKLVTFDVTNTVIKLKRSVGHIYASHAKDFGINLNPIDVDTSFRQFWKEQNHRLPNYGLSSGLTPKQWWANLVRATFDSVNLNCSDILFNQIYDDFAGNKNWQVYPESSKVLAKLKNHGLILAVISNFDERLPSILKSLDVLKYFSFCLTSVEAKCCKPDVEIFKMALEKVSAPACESIHIGDNLELDYLAAKAVGMEAVLLDRSNNQSQNSPHVITHLSDLYSILI